MNLKKYTTVLGFILLFAYLASPSAYSQKKRQPLPVPDGEEAIVEDPDIPPMFTGGTAQMRNFISVMLKYPPEAAENNIQGLVVHTFVVEKDGTLSNLVCIHHADSLLDAEALRILKAMPPWRPGKLNGEAVRTKSYVPMYFRLNKSAQRRAAQSSSAASTPVPTPIAKADSTVFENNEVYTIVDQMPQYPGGETKLAEFLSDKMEYPVQARQEGIQGRITCSFIVAKDGSISNIEVVDGVNSALNDEAVRMLSLMPNWIPGMNNGENVNVKCLLPIDFKIDETPIPPVTTE